MPPSLYLVIIALRLKPGEAIPCYLTPTEVILGYMDEYVRRAADKKVLVFDLDGTLTPSKAVLPAEMAKLLQRAIERYTVSVISGGSFVRFQKQLLAALPDDTRLDELVLLPTCGTQRYAYDRAAGSWKRVYVEALSETEKQRIHEVLQAGIQQLGFDQTDAYGELLEDRDSQITYSALGQDIVELLGAEGLRRKAEWDPDDNKKQQLVAYAAPKLEGYDVRISSPTSIDVTKPGMDKAYGIRKLMALLNVHESDIVFFGDRLEEGGNDYPVKARGVDCVAVSGWQDTAAILAAILDTEYDREER